MDSFVKSRYIKYFPLRGSGTAQAVTKGCLLFRPPGALRRLCSLGRLTPLGYLFTAGAGALSAKHEEMPLGYPRPTVIWLFFRNAEDSVPYGGQFGFLAEMEAALRVLGYPSSTAASGGPPSPLGRLSGRPHRAAPTVEFKISFQLSIFSYQFK